MWGCDFFSRWFTGIDADENVEIDKMRLWFFYPADLRRWAQMGLWKFDEVGCEALTLILSDLHGLLVFEINWSDFLFSRWFTQIDADGNVEIDDLYLWGSHTDFLGFTRIFSVWN